MMQILSTTLFLFLVLIGRSAIAVQVTDFDQVQLALEQSAPSLPRMRLPVYDRLASMPAATKGPAATYLLQKWTCAIETAFLKRHCESLSRLEPESIVLDESALLAMIHAQVGLIQSLQLAGIQHESLSPALAALAALSAGIQNDLLLNPSMDRATRRSRILAARAKFAGIRNLLPPENLRYTYGPEVSFTRPWVVLTNTLDFLDRAMSIVPLEAYFWESLVTNRDPAARGFGFSCYYSEPWLFFCREEGGTRQFHLPGHVQDIIVAGWERWEGSKILPKGFSACFQLRNRQGKDSWSCLVQTEQRETTPVQICELNLVPMTGRGYRATPEALTFWKSVRGDKSRMSLVRSSCEPAEGPSLMAIVPEGGITRIPAGYILNEGETVTVKKVYLLPPNAGNLTFFDGFICGTAVMNPARPGEAFCSNQFIETGDNIPDLEHLQRRLSPESRISRAFHFESFWEGNPAVTEFKTDGVYACVPEGSRIHCGKSLKAFRDRLSYASGRPNYGYARSVDQLRFQWRRAPFVGAQFAWDRSPWYLLPETGAAVDPEKAEPKPLVAIRTDQLTTPASFAIATKTPGLTFGCLPNVDGSIECITHKNAESSRSYQGQPVSPPADHAFSDLFYVRHLTGRCALTDWEMVCTQDEKPFFELPNQVRRASILEFGLTSIKQLRPVGDTEFCEDTETQVRCYSLGTEGKAIRRAVEKNGREWIPHLHNICLQGTNDIVCEPGPLYPEGLRIEFEIAEKSEPLSLKLIGEPQP